MKRVDPSSLSLASDEAEPANETLWLLGQPQLSTYLEFVREKTHGGPALEPRALADEWRAANDIYYELETAEAGLAETIDVRPLAPMLAEMAAQLRADPYFRGSFDTLPVEIAMVELDKLIASQTFITRSFSEGLAAGIGDDPESLFRFCLPTGRPLPPVTMQRLASNRFQFVSPSTDFRPHRAQLLDAAQLAGLQGYGPAAAGVAVAAGFGSNFLMAVRSGPRLLLQNGYHRAYALRASGITHAPCVVQTVTRRDELRIAATEEVCADPSFYFAAARPPLFKDFFDPRLVKRLPTRRLRTLVEVELRVRMTTLVE